MDEWAALDEPWRACLELTWEAYLAGTIPVGAVVVDAAGAIVARGRNRILDPPDGSLAGTRLAHAEVAALAQLPATSRYSDHVLYSSLEPCLLCVGAAAMSKIGGIRYAAADPYGGACAVEIANPDFARASVTIDGPADTWVARLAAALSVAFWLRRDVEATPPIVAAFGGDAAGAGERVLSLDGSLGPSLATELPRLLPLL